MPIRTFLDAGVLIAAHRGEPALQEAALTILQDQRRVFLASPFLDLELLPKPTYFSNQAESAFFERYLSRARQPSSIKPIVALALAEARRCGLGALDALHLAAAHLMRADEFITTELPTKPMYRSGLVQVMPLC